MTPSRPIAVSAETLQLIQLTMTGPLTLLHGRAVVVMIAEINIGCTLREGVQQGKRAAMPV
jgi:hypothetical protein